LQTARTINGTSFDGTANITITAAAGTLTGTTLNATVVTSSLTAVGTIGTGVWQGTSVSTSYTDAKVTSVAARTGAVVLTAADVAAGTFPAGSFSVPTLAVTSGLTLTGATITGQPTWSSSQNMNISGSAASTTGNAATATALATPRAINGVNFDGTAAITVTAAAGTLSGTTLAAGVTASSLTSVGTLGSLTVSGAITMTATASRIIPGATSWAVRDTSNGFDNLIITDAGVGTFRGPLFIATSLYVNSVQVVGGQEAAVADASGGGTIDAQARTAINSLLARCRSHGLIAT